MISFLLLIMIDVSAGSIYAAAFDGRRETRIKVQIFIKR